MGTKNKLLVALDGSETSFEAVRYVASVVSPCNWDIHLFHVWDPVPEGFWDFEINPLGRAQNEAIRAWRVRVRRNIEEFLGRAQDYLITNGFDNEQVSVRIQIREQSKGVERDIAAEARKGGYHAVVLGRRGLSNLSDFVMGTVTQRLIACLTDVPLWIVGKTVDSDKLLIGVDLSEGAMKAVEHVAHTFSCGLPLESICLFHAIRGIAPERGRIARSFAPVEQKQWMSRATGEIQRVKEEIEKVFETARNCLEKKGVPSNRIVTKVVCGVKSRAATIVEYARQEGYGTIVLGRRGLSRFKEFFIGRVSNKVLNMVHYRAVWVVSSHRG